MLELLTRERARLVKDCSLQVVIKSYFALFKRDDQFLVPGFKLWHAEQKTLDRKIPLLVVPRIGEEDPADIPEECADRWHKKSYCDYS